MIGWFLLWNGSAPVLQDYGFFEDQIRKGNVENVELTDEVARGTFIDPPLDPQAVIEAEKAAKEKAAKEKAAKETGDKEKTETTPAKEEKSAEIKRLAKNFEVQLPRSPEALKSLQDLLIEHNVAFKFAKGDNTTSILLMVMFLLPLGFVFFMWLSTRRARNEMMGGGGFLSGFSKSPAKRYEATKQRITFADVAGLEGVKADLMEIVDFLKSPEKFRRLGGRIPKGVLLNGPPGTGKTLLARAVAGEAEVPYFSVSGSEFIQMFVGVGASRVRDLFKNAKESAPAIIFIDEIDAVGRQRGAGLGGGHDEREQTLNQILSEMDGFTPNDSVIVLGATNRPDVLDPALLRPGRFDRHITVGRPTLKGRKEIFQVHVRDVPLADDVDLDIIAAAAVGLTGADIRNIVNEAALWAARNDKSVVSMADFNYARDKVLMGAKRDEVLSGEEKESTAYHEAGHALLAWLLPGAHRVHKVTVIPRGRSLGATHWLPSEDRLSMSEPQLRDHLVTMLGGRAAEKLIYNQATNGAENDLERATGLARRMVTNWGMTERLGPVSYKMSDEDPFLGREMHQQRQFSEHTMELIDEEVARILHETDERAMQMLVENRGKLKQIADALVEHEELDEKQLTALIGPSVHAAKNGKPDEIKPEEGMIIAPDEKPAKS
ncbi:ATP-dependent zinc metalloprotease FtsH [Lignipirellula cremea]|nr:ATP-dependent zinc metalloprotease FtsH [Lignipirellula cremea]